MKPQKKYFSWSKLFFLSIPLLTFFLWFYDEYNSFEITPFEIISGYTTPDEFVYTLINQKNEYELNKDNYPTKLGITEYSEYSDFKSALSDSFTNQIGILSKLPIYRVCLKNNNKIYIEGQLRNDLPGTQGAIGILQQGGGYKFYAERNDKDCKLVKKTDFMNSLTRTELGYAVEAELSFEDTEKMLSGSNDYKIYVKSYVNDTSKSSFKFALSFWTIVPFYILMIWPWSYIYFHYLKIYKYLRQKE